MSQRGWKDKDYQSFEDKSFTGKADVNMNQWKKDSGEKETMYAEKNTSNKRVNFREK